MPNADAVMPKHDSIQKLNHSTLQHGPYNRRIYLMKLDPRDLPDIPVRLETLAQQKGYDKILAKVQRKHREYFASCGFNEEAAVPEYFKDGDDALFMAKYLSARRRKREDADTVKEILSLCRQKSSRRGARKEKESPVVHDCRPADAKEMSRLFHAVFQTYPFPVFDPGFLVNCMNSHTRYFCIRRKGQMTAVSAAEIDANNHSAEMTDFATLAKHRSHGLAGYLLARMEQSMMQQGITTLFSIARALSPAMNITFAKFGYTYGGTLVNNTNISGRIESMNIWYKQV